MSKLAEASVAILAGGLGTRLQSIVKNTPKVLAKVGNQTFLEYILDQLNSENIKEVILCTGYLGEQVETKLGKKYKNLNLLYSHEKSPKGTGGGLRLALPYFKSKDVLVMNGDSFCDVNLEEFWKFHRNKKADISLVTTNLSDTSRFGKINLHSQDQILSFEEKKEEGGEGYINAGIYLIKKSLISEISENIEVSLEKEVFPNWTSNNFYGYKTDGRFLDIGTPQSYSQAEKFFKENNKKRFILLDRDGTLIVHKPYLSHPDQIELIPGGIEVLKEFRNMGLGIVMITNQSGIGRGYFDLKTLEEIHQRLTKMLAENGVYLDDIYFCPHAPEDDCLCRKPKVELIEKAMEKHYFDPKLCFVIGDNKSDIGLGKNIGATTILVRTGHGTKIEKENKVKPDFVVDSLKETLSIIKANIN